MRKEKTVRQIQELRSEIEGVNLEIHELVLQEEQDEGYAARRWEGEGEQKRWNAELVREENRERQLTDHKRAEKNLFIK